MKIKFFRGNDHEIKIRFKTFTGELEKMYLTVRCEKGVKRLQKTLSNGITKENDYYIIKFIPEDTNNVDCSLNMTYDIKIIVDGKRKTIAKDFFVLDEENTRLEDEV